MMRHRKPRVIRGQRVYSMGAGHEIAFDATRERGAPAATPAVHRLGPWTVSVVTRDRPAAAMRAIQSLIDNLRRHGRPAEVFVADDSGPEAARILRAGLRGLARDPDRPIRYAGRAERATFIEQLIAQGVPPATVRFALTDALDLGLAIGMNRNVTLLQSIDGRLAGYDDDIVCRPVLPPGHEPGARLFFAVGDGYDNYNPAEYWFYPDRESLLADMQFVDVDVLDSHESVLGKTPLEIDPDLDVTEARDPVMLNRSLDGEARVVASLQGNYGDVGWYAATWLMMVEGATRGRLMRSAESYRTSCHSSRELLRAVRRTSLTEGRFLQNALLAVDVSGAVAPFIPVGRYEDGVFRMTQRAIDRGALFAHVPVSLLHDPIDTRRFQREDIWKTGAWVRIGETMVQCIRAFQPSGGDPQRRTRALGRHLADLAAEPPADLAHFLRERFVAQKSLYVAHYETLLERYDHQPADWAEDVLRHLDTIRTSLLGEDFLAPADLTVGGKRSPAEARALFARLLGGFGDVLEHWPDVLEATRRLRQREVRIGVPP